jgi:hypothetical protein
LQLESLEERAVPALTSTGGVVNTLPLNLSGNDIVTSSAASARNGLSVIAWMARGKTTNFDIHAQMYNADHSKHGAEIIVSATAAVEADPSVSMANNGNWVVAWTAMLASGDKNVYAARFSSSGARLGHTFAVAASSSIRENTPSVACAGNGDFVVAYTAQAKGSANKDVLARMYRSNGAFLRQIAVSNTKFVEQNPEVARSTSSNAGFSIAFQIGKNIRLKTYTGTGVLTGNHVLVDDGNAAYRPDVSRDDAGDTVIAWQESIPGTDPYTGAPTVDTGIRARVVSASGTVGKVINVSLGTSGTGDPGEYYAIEDSIPAVAMNPTTGSFVVAYQEFDDENTIFSFVQSTTVFAAEFTAAGKAHGSSSVPVSMDRPDLNPYPTLSISAGGAYLLVYTNQEASPPTVNWQLGQLS